MKISNKTKATYKLRSTLYRDVYFDPLTAHHYQRDKVMYEYLKRGHWSFPPMNNHFLNLLAERIRQYEDYLKIKIEDFNKG